MVNDVTSNGEMVAAKAELDLREAGLKFRGPGTGDSEGLLREEISGAGCCWEAIVSVREEDREYVKSQRLKKPP